MCIVNCRCDNSSLSERRLQLIDTCDLTHLSTVDCDIYQSCIDCVEHSMSVDIPTQVSLLVLYHMYVKSTMSACVAMCMSLKARMQVHRPLRIERYRICKDSITPVKVTRSPQLGGQGHKVKQWGYQGYRVIRVKRSRSRVILMMRSHDWCNI